MIIFAVTSSNKASARDRADYSKIILHIWKYFHGTVMFYLCMSQLNTTRPAAEFLTAFCKIPPVIPGMFIAEFWSGAIVCRVIMWQNEC